MPGRTDEDHLDVLALGAQEVLQWCEVETPIGAADDDADVLGAERFQGGDHGVRSGRQTVVDPLSSVVGGDCLEAVRQGLKRAESLRQSLGRRIWIETQKSADGGE